jgi:SCO1/SenC
VIHRLMLLRSRSCSHPQIPSAMRSMYQPSFGLPRALPSLASRPALRVQTDAAAKAYRVYHMKTDESEDYLVDHSIIMYLVNPDGDFVQFFGKNVDAPGVAKAIQGHMASWKPKAAEA